MTKFKENWNRFSTARKILTVLVWVIGCVVLLLSVFGLLNFLPLEQTNPVVLLLLGISFSINGILQKENKAVRILLILVSVFILLSLAVVFVPKMLHEYL